MLILILLLQEPFTIEIPTKPSWTYTTVDWLPPEAICAGLYAIAEKDLRRIYDQLQYETNWRRRTDLLAQKLYTEKCRTIWYFAWWVNWPKAGQTQRKEYLELLLREPFLLLPIGLYEN